MDARFFFTVNGYISVLFFLFRQRQHLLLRPEGLKRIQIQLEDKRLQPIFQKVQANMHLNAEDGVALFKSSDIFGHQVTWRISFTSANTAT